MCIYVANATNCGLHLLLPWSVVTSCFGGSGRFRNEVRRVVDTRQSRPPDPGLTAK